MKPESKPPVGRSGKNLVVPKKFKLIKVKKPKRTISPLIITDFAPEPEKKIRLRKLVLPKKADPSIDFSNVSSIKLPVQQVLNSVDSKNKNISGTLNGGTLGNQEEYSEMFHSLSRAETPPKPNRRYSVENDSIFNQKIDNFIL